MRKNKNLNKAAACLLAFTLTAALFSGCGKKQPENASPNTDVSAGQNEVPQDEVPQNGEALAFRPAESGIPAMDAYEYPYMGLGMVLSKTIQERMSSYDVLMQGSEDYSPDGTLKYAFLSWYALTEAQKTETVTAYDPQAWLSGLTKMGTLGAIHSSAISELDALTGCTEHKEIGKSTDGAYTYYLSFAKSADETLKAELAKTEVSILPMQKADLANGVSAFSEGRAQTGTDQTDAADSNTFRATDINGKEYTEELFRKYDLTLVNVFTTWCSPCIGEMPALEKFRKEMEAKGIGIASFVYDTVTETGDPDPGALETAKQLQKKASLGFPMLLPDRSILGGRLKGITSYPETFFVDKNGNIVGETYLGTHSFAEWKKIAENELAALKGSN